MIGLNLTFLIEDNLSIPMDSVLKEGIPQGSALASILFLIYNDLNHAIKYSTPFFR